VFEWIKSNDTLLAWLAVISVVCFIATLVLVPVVIIRIPHDYFSSQRRRKRDRNTRHFAAKFALAIGKNVLGCIFLLAGTAMLVLPGQGLLTILVGIMFLNFPGKYRFERWLVSRPPLLNSINWLRKSRGLSPLKF
jgi:hypothetical protein